MKPAVSSLARPMLALAIAFGSTPLAAAEFDCLIQPHQVIQVGSAVPGVLHEVVAERGDTVVRGQTLARLQDSVERAALRLAQARAKASSWL